MRDRVAAVRRQSPAVLEGEPSRRSGFFDLRPVKMMAFVGERLPVRAGSSRRLGRAGLAGTGVLLGRGWLARGRSLTLHGLSRCIGSWQSDLGTSAGVVGQFEPNRISSYPEPLLTC